MLVSHQTVSASNSRRVCATAVGVKNKACRRGYKSACWFTVTDYCTGGRALLLSKGAFINTLVGGLGKMEGAKKVLSYQKGGTKKFSVVKGGSKKFSQIESIMKIKMHNLLPKLTGYSLRLDLYFKIFPGPSAGPA